MAEYIGCRNCDSPDCKGCNLKNLETMLKNGKFDCLMNENRCINQAADVAPVRRAKWVDNHCTACGMMPMGDEMWKNHDCEPPLFERFMDYCPSCGAKMDGELNE